MVPRISSLSAAATSGAFVGFLSSAGFFLATGIAGVLTARALEPSGKGAVALALSWAGAFLQLGGFGLSHAFAVKVGRASEDGDRELLARRLWYDGSVLALVIGAAVTLLGLLVADVVTRTASAEAAVRLIALASIPLLLMGNQYGLLRGLHRFRSYAIAFVVQPVAWLVCVLAMFLLDAISVLSVLISYIGTLCLSVLLGALFLRRELRSWIGGSWIGAFRQLRDSWLFGVSGLAIFGNGRMDQLLLGALATTSAVGIYSVSVSFAALLSPLSSGFALVSLPRVASSASDAEGRGIVAANLRRFLLVATPLAVLMWAAASTLIPMLFGDQYRGSVRPVAVLVVAQLVLGVNHILHEGVRGMGLVRRSTLSEVTAFLVGIPVFVLAIDSWGIMGAAAASLAVYVIAGAALSWSAFRGRSDRDHLGGMQAGVADDDAWRFPGD